MNLVFFWEVGQKYENGIKSINYEYEKNIAKVTQ